MGTLKNPKHERFAVALAKGQSATAAYVTAGYAENEGNAGRLNRNEQVQTRVTELQERGAEKAAVTLAGMTARLLRLADKGEALGDAPGLSVARASVMDACKLNGLVVDRSDVTSGGAALPLSLVFRAVFPTIIDGSA